MFKLNTGIYMTSIRIPIVYGMDDHKPYTRTMLHMMYVDLPIKTHGIEWDVWRSIWFVWILRWI